MSQSGCLKNKTRQAAASCSIASERASKAKYRSERSSKQSALSRSEEHQSKQKYRSKASSKRASKGTSNYPSERGAAVYRRIIQVSKKWERAYVRASSIIEASSVEASKSIDESIQATKYPTPPGNISVARLFAVQKSWVISSCSHYSDKTTTKLLKLKFNFYLYYERASRTAPRYERANSNLASYSSSTVASNELEIAS
jgi:hypothetical protein